MSWLGECEAEIMPSGGGGGGGGAALAFMAGGDATRIRRSGEGAGKVKQASRFVWKGLRCASP